MSQTRRLAYLLLLNLVIIAGLVLAGLFSHSLSVLAAGGDFIADSFAIALGILAVYMRDKYGKSKAPSYVALVNAFLLLGVTIFVLIEAASRLVGGSPEIHGLPVLVTAIASTMAMIAGVFILGRGAGNEDLHMRSVLLDTISDGLSAAVVAIVGGIIYFAHGLYWLDAAAATLISLIIAYGAVKLLRDVYLSLRHGKDLELDDD